MLIMMLVVSSKYVRQNYGKQHYLLPIKLTPFLSICLPELSVKKRHIRIKIKIYLAFLSLSHSLIKSTILISYHSHVHHVLSILLNNLVIKQCANSFGINLFTLKKIASLKGGFCVIATSTSCEINICVQNFVWQTLNH